jgi:hypothetical protein
MKSPLENEILLFVSLSLLPLLKTRLAKCARIHGRRALSAQCSVAQILFATETFCPPLAAIFVATSHIITRVTHNPTVLAAKVRAFGAFAMRAVRLAVIGPCCAKEQFMRLTMLTIASY